MAIAPRRHVLAGGAALAALAAGGLPAAAQPASAQLGAQQQPEGGLRGARNTSRRGQVLPNANLVSNWSVSLNATYSDNFRRLPTDLRRTFTTVGEDGVRVPFRLPVVQEVIDPRQEGPIFDPEQTIEVVGGLAQPRDQVEIEPPDNVIATFSLNGGTVLDRPGITGIVQGGIEVSAYADNDPLDSRLSDALVRDIDPAAFGPFSDPDALVLGEFELPDTGQLVEFVVPGTNQPASLDQFDDLEGTTGRGDVEAVFVRPNIRGSATVRAVEDLVYVDASAIAQQESLSLRNEVEEESAGRLASQVTFVGGSLSPYLFRELRAGSTAELRYRFTGVFVADESRRGDDPVTAGGEVRDDQRFSNDSIGNELLAEYRTGQIFGRLGFALRGQASSTREDGSDVLNEVELDRLSASVEASYDVNRALTVLGETGYDEVDLTQTDPNFAGGAFGPVVIGEDELSGFFWQLGLRAVPGRRTTANLAVGERFGGRLIEADVTYQPTARLLVSLGADRQLSTGAQDQFAGFGALNSRALTVVERLSDIQGTSAQRLLEQVVSFQGGFDDVQRRQAGAGTVNRYRAGLNYNRLRTSAAVSVAFTETQFTRTLRAEDGTVSQDDDSNENLSLNVSAQRQFTRRFSMNTSARYLSTQGFFFEDALLSAAEGGAGAGGGDTEQFFVSLGTAYQIGPRLALTARAYHSQRSGGTNLEFDENAVSAGLRFTF